MQRFFKACLILLLISAPVTLYAQDTNEAAVKGITTGRASAIAVGVLALISVIIGWRAKLRSNSVTSNKRAGAVGAIMLALISIILCIVHLSTSAGAVFGSGSGKAGVIVALVLGVSGMVLGWLALARYRRNTERMN